MALDPRPARELPLLELLAEDFSTYDRRVSEPGLWAVVAHRLGERSRSCRFRSARLALRTSHRVLSTAVDLMWGIHIPGCTQLGRRVRLWHSGCMQLEARSIGDDVQIRHDTTLGGVRARDTSPSHWPQIEERVELGSGVSILGPVCVGHDAFVGANSLVLKHVPPNSTVLGVPARVLPT